MTALLPTDEGILMVSRGEADAEAIGNALMVLRKQRADTQDMIDDLTAVLRRAVEATGKQSATFGSVKVVLKLHQSMACACIDRSDHFGTPSILACPKALRGDEVLTQMVESARYVDVYPVAK